MTLGKLFSVGRRGRASTFNREEAVIVQVASHVVCETLERRRLLATFTYVVPPGHTAAYIEEVPFLDGQVQVRLDLPTNPVAHTFTNDTGLDIIDSGTNNPPGGFLFVDKVSAEDKPTVDPNAPNDPFGIKVQGNSGGHLRIEGAAADKAFRIIESTATSGNVEVTDNAFNPNTAYSRFGSGVNKLTIQTSTDGGASVRVATREPIPSTPQELPGLHSTTSLTIESLGHSDQIALGSAENASVHAVVQHRRRQQQSLSGTELEVRPRRRHYQRHHRL